MPSFQPFRSSSKKDKTTEDIVKKTTPFRFESMKKNDSLEQTPSLQGDLSEIELINVLQLFDLAGLTGELHITTHQNSALFYFDNGAFIFGMLETKRKKIGQRLISEGLITNEQLEECLAIHHKLKNRVRLGKVLMEKGYIQPEKLMDSLTSEVKEAFFETLTWKEGSFSFYRNQKPEKEDIFLHEKIAVLLLEGMIQIDNKD